MVVLNILNKKYNISFCLSFIFILFSSFPLFSACQDIFQMNIKQLMNVQVESVSKAKEDIIKSASAVYIITSEDIKKSGVTTLPDLFKSVPGVDVVRVDSNKWGVAVRGFNGVFSNKLMVLVDGVNIYNHLFAGVFWDVQSIPLETIDRIEIIRGASGTMWGANAVNGVINIITKKASDMKGIDFNAAYGKNADDAVNLLYGNKIGENLNFALDVNFQDYYKVDYKNLRDEPVYLKGLLKIDYNEQNDNIQFLSDLASAKTKNLSQIPVKNNGIPENINVNGRYNFDYQFYSVSWEHSFSDFNKSKLLVYYINSDISSYYNNIERYVHRHVNTRTFTLDFQDNLKIDNHNIIWGGEYRYDRDSNNRTDFTIGDKLRKSYNLYNFFIAAKLSFTKSFNVSIGTKYEYNDSISDGAFLSTIKLAYYPDDKATLWFSFSNSVRTPSSLETEAILPVISVSGGGSGSSQSTVAKLFGNNDFNYEKIYSFELGFKKLFSDNLYFDLSLFYNHYNDLSVMAMGNMIKENSYFVLPLFFKNGMDGNVYGFEAWSRIKFFDKLILSPFYSYCYIDLNDHNNFRDESGFYKNSYPTFKFGSNIQVELSKAIKIYSLIYYKDALPYYKISDYTGLDIKIAYIPNKHISFALTGQDLLRNRHREFSNELVHSDDKIVRRSILFNISYKY